VYAAQNFHDGRSDYLIWRSGSVTEQVEELAADELGRRLLQVAGLVEGVPGNVATGAEYAH
jgi:hypothetical protein